MACRLFLLEGGVREDPQMTTGVGPLTSSGHPLVVQLLRVILNPSCERVEALHVNDLRCVAPPLQRGHEDRD
eukprot:557437-Alexandrium_andersonii.AAC.1